MSNDQAGDRAEFARCWRRRCTSGAILAGATGLAAGLAVMPAAAAPPPPSRAAARPVLNAKPAATCQGQPAPWMNTRLSPDQRASLLVSQMTLAQEVQMTATVSNATETREVPAIPSLCIPALLLTNGSAGI